MKGSIFEGAAAHTAMAGKKSNAPSASTKQGSNQGQSRSATKIKQVAYAGTRAPKTTSNPDLVSFTNKK